MTVLDTTASPPAQADRASFKTWAMVLGALLGAFMAVLNIQITNASLLYIEGGIGTGVDNGAWISKSVSCGSDPRAAWRRPKLTAVKAIIQFDR